MPQHPLTFEVEPARGQWAQESLERKKPIRFQSVLGRGFPFNQRECFVCLHSQKRRSVHIYLLSESVLTFVKQTQEVIQDSRCHRFEAQKSQFLCKCFFEISILHHSLHFQIGEYKQISVALLLQKAACRSGCRPFWRLRTGYVKSNGATHFLKRQLHLQIVQEIFTQNMNEAQPKLFSSQP